MIFEIQDKMITLIHNVKRPLPGLLLTVLITVLAMWLATFPTINHLGLSALTLAIVIGILIGNSFYGRVKPSCADGVQLAKQHLLRLGIILYGFRLTFQQISDVGITGIMIDLLTLSSTFLLACWLGKHLFGMDKQTAILIGAGSSICGAAAVMATEPVVKANAEKVAVAVATVVIFGTLAIFIYPWLYQLNLQHQWIHITEHRFGIYIGSTVHEVAQVVAAGHTIGSDAENAAVITKMIRVMLLAPFLLLLSLFLQRCNHAATGNKTAPMTIPWFAVLFILVACINSLHLLPLGWFTTINTVDTLLLAMAMSALGLTTHVSAIRQAGVQPILMATLLFIWLIVGGAGINLLVHHLDSLI